MARIAWGSTSCTRAPRLVALVGEDVQLSATGLLEYIQPAPSPDRHGQPPMRRRRRRKWNRALRVVRILQQIFSLSLKLEVCWTRLNRRGERFSMHMHEVVGVAWEEACPRAPDVSNFHPRPRPAVSALEQQT